MYLKMHYLFTWFNTVLGRNSISICFQQYVKQNKINQKLVFCHFVINSAAQLQQCSTTTTVQQNYNSAAQLQQCSTTTTVQHNYNSAAQLQQCSTTTTVQHNYNSAAQLQLSHSPHWKPEAVNDVMAVQWVRWLIAPLSVLPHEPPYSIPGQFMWDLRWTNGQ